VQYAASLVNVCNGHVSVYHYPSLNACNVYGAAIHAMNLEGPVMADTVEKVEIS